VVAKADAWLRPGSATAPVEASWVWFVDRGRLAFPRPAEWKLSYDTELQLESPASSRMTFALAQIGELADTTDELVVLRDEALSIPGQYERLFIFYKGRFSVCVRYSAKLDVFTHEQDVVTAIVKSILLGSAAEYGS
jgi:hypothetical protein